MGDKIVKSLISFVFLSIILVLIWIVRSANSTQISVVVAVASAFISSLSAMAAWFVVYEMRLDRESRERPQVIPQFDIKHNSVIYFCLRNIGNGIARDIRVKLSPDLIDIRGQALSTLPVFQEGIAILEPGQEFRQFFHTGISLFGEDSIPRQSVITVEYKGLERKKYKGEFHFDLEVYKNAFLPPKSVEEHLDEISKYLKCLCERFKSVTTLSSVIVETPSQYRKRLQRVKEAEE